MQRGAGGRRRIRARIHTPAHKVAVLHSWILTAFVKTERPTDRFGTFSAETDGGRLHVILHSAAGKICSCFYLFMSGIRM